MAKTDVDIAAVRHLARSLNANPFFNSLVVAAEFARSHALDASRTKTLGALVTRFNGPTAPLEDVAREFFGMGKDKAYEHAALNRLPVPTFRCTNSAKAPLLVYLEDLAALLDARHAQAHAEWKKRQLG